MPDNRKNLHRLIAIAENELTIEQQFAGDLKQCIESLNACQQHKPSQSYKPSSMNCIRNMYFQITGADIDKESQSSNLIGINESGTDRHLRLQKVISSMRKNKFDCDYVDIESFIKSRNLDYLTIVSKAKTETKIYDSRFNIRFMADGIIKYKGQYYILEIKTESANKYWIRNGVAENHYNQAICYSLSFGINQVMFIYENRDTLDKKAYVFNVTDDMKMGIIQKIEECDNHVKQLKPPAIPKADLRKLCQYCQYKNICKKVG